MPNIHIYIPDEMEIFFFTVSPVKYSHNCKAWIRARTHTHDDNDTWKGIWEKRERERERGKGLFSARTLFHTLPAYVSKKGSAVTIT